MNELYRCTDRVNESSELKAFLELHKFCAMQLYTKIGNNSKTNGPNAIYENINDSEMSVGFGMDSGLKGHLTLGSHYSTFDNNNGGNKRYESLSGSTRIDYMELDRLLSSGNGTLFSPNWLIDWLINEWRLISLTFKYYKILFIN